MTDLNMQVQQDIDALTAEWINHNYLQTGDLVVVGCSTSEIAGAQIGTAGSEAIATTVYDYLQHLKQQTGIQLVFQCCEHLNRALVIEKEMMEKHRLEEVSVIPVPSAGGSMASCAFQKMKNPVVVESIKAHAGIDIGETMIGMHLRHVAVPIRFAQKSIGKARVTGARTRPKLIGGARANYEKTAMNTSCK